ncbi:hypothetical protein [Bacillus toyonensis]|uniref:hypothetical protein n=1 Tax=Bacillus toyonensis TaxID=155322 RepID=UPI0011A960ED|nr:hypothetical protein [Bacillus toyonensis]
MEKKLDPFLPTVEEIEKMDRFQFEEWMEDTYKKINKRELLRDPLYHFQKEVSQLLNNSYKSEVEKERVIQKAMKKYYETIR